ncbi:cyclic pyranopterin monophosphate synthase MoaC [Bryobacter aggregatus]|uniref:cyclic pyranopterin monophosphate synthase MoaC n=1 Tax=Bryobacter aggregatus TaxID=360054 RepID=UPI0004E27080|nr:cyclic pyranopterin monophosphate synthase MoaC [Bryobacter aggregatus]
MSKLSHYDEAGSARMVDISGKSSTVRTARGHAFVKMPAAVLAALPHNPKGDPLEVARVAAILAAKRTWELIPLCHQIPLAKVDLEFGIEDTGIRVTSAVACTAGTGAEMEALTAAAIAALTIYDMTKALDKGIEITDLYLLSKSGGKSGDYERPGND